MFRGLYELFKNVFVFLFSKLFLITTIDLIIFVHIDGNQFIENRRVEKKSNITSEYHFISDNRTVIFSILNSQAITQTLCLYYASHLPLNTMKSKISFKFLLHVSWYEILLAEWSAVHCCTEIGFWWLWKLNNTKRERTLSSYISYSLQTFYSGTTRIRLRVRIVEKYERISWEGDELLTNIFYAHL